MLFATYFPAWREYNAALERRFLPVANNTFATFIDEPLRLGYENLSNLTNLETHFLKISTILAYATDVLDELCVLVRSISQTQGRQRASTEYFRNERAQCIACSRNATHLQQRVQTTARLLADTLLLRDQVVAKEQNKNIFQLNKSAVFITTLTLLYLPSSFMAVSLSRLCLDFLCQSRTSSIHCPIPIEPSLGDLAQFQLTLYPQQTFFGMNFFAMDQQNSRIVGTSMVWIFVVCSTILTAATFLFYYWLLHRDGTVFRRLVPKVNIAPEWNLQALKRQLTDRIRTGAEMQELQA